MIQTKTLRFVAAAALLLGVASCRNNSTGPTNTNTSSGNWTLGTAGTSQNLVIGQFVDANTGFAAGANGVFAASNDSGNTWTVRGSAPAFATSNGPGVIYGLSFFNSTTGVAVGDQRDISSTFDGGNSWNPIDASSISETELIRSLYFTNDHDGFIGTADAYADPSGSIYRSTDGGKTWNPIASTVGGIYAIGFTNIGFGVAGSDGVAMGRFGVDYWTSDGGATWNPGTTDQPNSLISHCTFVNATTGFAAATTLGDTQHGFILRTDDAGHTWHTVKSVSPAVDGIASSGLTITAVGFNGTVVESTDLGTTWTQSSVGNSRWDDVEYSSPTHAVLFGDNGNIAQRNK
jgi:photosystem II stability/assembly factor-like uncharacterized protein